MAIRLFTCNWTLMPAMDPVEMVRFTAREGFSGIEFECGPLYFWPTTVSDSLVRELKAVGDGEGVALSVHAPDHINPASELPENRLRDAELVRRLIDLAVRFESPVVGIHPGVAESLFDLERKGIPFDTDRHDRSVLVADARNRAVETIAEWGDWAAAAGLILTVENEVHVRHTVAPTAGILDEMISATGHEGIKVNFDTGHAYCGGGLQEEFGTLCSRIVHFHLDDGDTPGVSQHLPLGEGKADFRPLAEFMTTFGGIMVLEIYAPDRPVEATLASRDFLLRVLAAA